MAESPSASLQLMFQAASSPINATHRYRVCGKLFRCTAAIRHSGISGSADVPGLSIHNISPKSVCTFGTTDQHEHEKGDENIPNAWTHTGQH
jgi:hypothetical protein